MSRTLLSEDQWLTLFADEKAGMTRRALAAKYGVHPSTISRQASERGLLKRQTGAPDHRCIPPGGWDPDRPIPQSRAGMTGRKWDAALDRYLAGEDAAVVAADIGLRRGDLTARARNCGRQKKDTPGAVYRVPGPKPVIIEHQADNRVRLHHKSRAFLLDLDQPEATFAELTALARECADTGWFMSFAGTATFKNAQNLRDALDVAPRNLLLLETDAPYLTPMPHRGRPNAPYLLPHTVRSIATHLGTDPSMLAAQISSNTEYVYGHWDDDPVTSPPDPYDTPAQKDRS